MNRLRNKLIFLLSALILLVPKLQGQIEQQLSITLVNAKTQEPVQDAFVFFSGSSTGEISDTNGEVTLPYAPYLELVISHLNYQTKVLTAASLEAKKDIRIQLRPQAVDFETVTVKSSDKYAAKRKKRMKRFASAFLGGPRDRKQVNILNPEVILFSETAFGLKAEANAPIRVYSEALGYDLRFFLSNFLLNKKGETIYGGKAYFEELSTDRQSLASEWKEKRQEYFRSSKRYFFSKLAREEMEDEQYTIGSSTLTDDLEFVGFQEIEPENLQWKRGDRADTLVFSGFFTVLDRKIVTEFGSKSYYKVTTDEYATSFLRSRSGLFIISPTGILLNNKEIEELGYWAEQRIARLLPVDYLGEEVARPTVNVDQLLADSAPQEKAAVGESVYLQIDKPYYSLNDDLWFKAYLIDANAPHRRPPSNIIRVELIDPAGSIAQTVLLHKDQSLGGTFSLKELPRAGIYHLRAYTAYMRQRGDQSFFQLEIPIIDPKASASQSLTGVKLKAGYLAKEADQPFTETNLTVQAQDSSILPRQKVTLEISLPDSLLAEGATVSLAVTDRSSVIQDKAVANILDYFNGKRSYTVSGSGRQVGIDTLHLPKNTASIQGYISRKGKPQQRIRGEVLLTALHPQPVIKKVVTSKDGRFVFDALPYLDSVTYILQAAALKDQESIEGPVLSSKDRRVDIDIEEESPAEIHTRGTISWRKEALPEQFRRLAFQKAQLGSSLGSDWEIDLEAITVKGRKATDDRNQDVYNLNRLDWIEPKQPVSQLLSTLKPGYRFLRDINTNSLIAHVINSTGRMIIQPVSININGVPANLLQFERLRAEMIDYISITRTSIIIKTRAAPRPAAAAEGEGVLVYQHPGFYPGRVFPATNYGLENADDSQPDLRTTIHWEPEVRVEAGEKTIIRFYAADAASTYDVIIEGLTDAGEPIHQHIELRVSE